MSNVLGLCKDVLQQLINTPRFSLVQVSDAKTPKNDYKILDNGVKFLAFWTLCQSTVKKNGFLTIKHDFSLKYGYAEQHHKIILLMGLL